MLRGLAPALSKSSNANLALLLNQFVLTLTVISTFIYTLRSIPVPANASCNGIISEILALPSTGGGRLSALTDPFKTSPCACTIGGEEEARHKQRVISCS